MRGPCAEYPSLVNMIVSLVVVVSVDYFLYHLILAYVTLQTHSLPSPSLTGKTNHHPGNIKWRLVIEEKKDEYKTSLRTGKPIIAMEIVSIWRDQSPPGRFLRKDEETGLWDDIGDEDARIKCSQTLRERKESKLRLTDEGQSDKGAARRMILFEQKISAKRQQAVESESDDDTDDSDKDNDEEVAVVNVVVEDV